MGYYTSFEIKVVPDEDALFDNKAFEKWCEEMCIESCGNNTAWTHSKWYEWDDDLRAFSRDNPTLFITVIGEGEEAGDLWRAYLKAGKMQLCPATITYEPYDESKLV